MVHTISYMDSFKDFISQYTRMPLKVVTQLLLRSMCIFLFFHFFNLKYILFSPTNLGSVVEVSFNWGKNCVILDSDEEALLTTSQNLEEYMLKGNDSNDAWQL